jgi:hypothetical protein
VALSDDDRSALDALARAGELYEQYLRLAELGRIPAQDELVAEAVPPPINLPLTQVIHLP